MAYVVKRTYGISGSDYLHEWCDTWGTACMGSIKLAMQFDTFEQAQAAAIKAQSVCMGVDGPAKGMTFTPHQI
jgi:hypothetical protein